MAIESMAGAADSRHGVESPALLGRAEVRRLIVVWTLFYGVASWLLEWTYSDLGARHGMSFLEGSKAAVYAVVWAPLLCAAIWLTDRWPVRGVCDWRRIALHTVASMSAPFVWGTAAYFICVHWVPGWTPWGVGRMYLNTANGVLYVYVVVVVICHLVRRLGERRDEEIALVHAAEQATAAQLELLTLELQPHFLFNSLHAISALIHKDAGAASTALRDVRTMLHDALGTGTRSERTVGEELAALQPYLRLQELRFGERLRIEWHLRDESLLAAVPAWLLEPLLENAVKYSVEMLVGPRHISVDTFRDGEELVLLVTDDGVGLERAVGSRARGLRRGLNNVRERLRWLYGARQQLRCWTASGGQGTVVDVRLPFRLLERESDASATHRTGGAQHPLGEEVRA